MALDDGTLHIPGTGYIYLADASTVAPTVMPPGVAWTDLGHTSEDGLTINYEVDKEVLRTWRARTGARTRIGDVNFTVSWTGLQVDNDTLSAYFGGGDVATAGKFGVSKTPAVLEKALFIRLVDGATELWLHASKAAISSNGEIGATPEGFMTFPTSAQILDDSAASVLADWIGADLGA